MDFIVSNVLMPLGALGTTLVVGQLLDKKLLQQYFGKDRFRLFSGWYYLIRCDACRYYFSLYRAII